MHPNRFSIRHLFLLAALLWCVAVNTAYPKDCPPEAGFMCEMVPGTAEDAQRTIEALGSQRRPQPNDPVPAQQQPQTAKLQVTNQTGLSFAFKCFNGNNGSVPSTCGNYPTIQPGQTLDLGPILTPGRNTILAMVRADGMTPPQTFLQMMHDLVEKSVYVNNPPSQAAYQIQITDQDLKLVDAPLASLVVENNTQVPLLIQNIGFEHDIWCRFLDDNFYSKTTKTLSLKIGPMQTQTFPYSLHVGRNDIRVQALQTVSAFQQRDAYSEGVWVDNKGATTLKSQRSLVITDNHFVK